MLADVMTSEGQCSRTAGDMSAMITDAVGVYYNVSKASNLSCYSLADTPSGNSETAWAYQCCTQLAFPVSSDGGEASDIDCL